MKETKMEVTRKITVNPWNSSYQIEETTKPQKAESSFSDYFFIGALVISSTIWTAIGCTEINDRKMRSLMQDHQHIEKIAYERGEQLRQYQIEKKENKKGVFRWFRRD